MLGPRIVLGPQRPDVNLHRVLDEDVPGDGPLVLISAGWRHHEDDARRYLVDRGVEVVHLPLYAWFERIAQDHPTLQAAYSQRQAAIKEAKRAYGLRLQHGVAAVRDLLRSLDDAPKVFERELADALAGVRRLDQRLLDTSAAIHEGFPDVARPWEHPAAAARHHEARSALDGARAVLVSGGHVGVLRQRLLFFGLDDLIDEAHRAGTAVVAWSAGAMALSERIVLFYDDPPEGSAVPEVFDTGLGVLPGAVFLPHARRRLRLDDRERVALMANRFGPQPCVGLECGAHLRFDGTRWVDRGDPDTALQLRTDGSVGALGG